MSYSISELARALDLPYQGNGDRRITRVSGWAEADDSSLVFLEADYKSASATERLAAGCVIAPPGRVPSGWNALISERPKLDFARAARLVHRPAWGGGDRHGASWVSAEASIGRDVTIGPFVVVEAGASVGERSVLLAGVLIGRGSTLGRECILHPGVTLYPGAEIGNRVILHAGVVIGSDGFGYVFDGAEQVKFPQVGRVVVEDDVEIGANTTVDRGSLGTTRIGVGAKIDNLVQIGHNVNIGRGVVIAAQTGISGSTIIEDFAVIGGQVGFGDHARVQSGAVIGSKAGVLPGKIVRGGEVYWGVPVRPLRKYKRLNALFGRLPEMKAEIDALKAEVAELKKSLKKD